MRTQLSGRFMVLAALAYLFIFIGLIWRSGGLLALAVPLVVYLAAALLSPPPRLNLTAERTVSQTTVLQDSRVEATIRITNQGRSLDEVYIEDRLPPRVRLVEGKTSLLTGLPAGKTATIRYKFEAPRGSYTFDHIVISATDHLGVQKATVALAAAKHVLFLPEIHPLKRVAIRPARTHGHFGPIPSRQTGSGIDFYGLREYQMGDPRRWINWRTSARHDQRLFVNQFEQERIADVGIILDARQQVNVVLANGDSLFEYGVRAAGSLSEALLNDGNRVGMLIYGFGMERTFPGYGKVQQKRILRALGQARTGHNFALESLGYLPTRFFPPRSQIVMVSPLSLNDISPIQQLCACGYEMLVVSPNPVDFEAQSLKLNDETAWRIAQVERVLLLRRLQRLGVRVLDWKVDKPFEPLVRATLSRVSAGRGLGLRRVM